MRFAAPASKAYTAASQVLPAAVPALSALGMLAQEAPNAQVTPELVLYHESPFKLQACILTDGFLDYVISSHQVE